MQQNSKKICTFLKIDDNRARDRLSALTAMDYGDIESPAVGFTLLALPNFLAILVEKHVYARPYRSGLKATCLHLVGSWIGFPVEPGRLAASPRSCEDSAGSS